MQDRQLTYEETFRFASEARAHARFIIKKSSSQMAANKLRPEYFQGLRAGVKAVMELNLEEKSVFNPLIKDQTLSSFESTIAITSKYSLGNCFEMAQQALDYVLYQMPSHITAEIFGIGGGEHAFLVINRSPNSDPFNPMTWGENAVICDAWAEKNGVFSAKHFLKHLKNFYYSEDANYVEKFDLKRHKVVPISGFNTDHLRQVRTIENMKENFLDEMVRLLKILRSHVSLLESLKCSVDFDDPIMSNISEALIAFKRQICLTEDAESLVNKEYKEYRAAKSELSEVILLLTENTQLVLGSYEKIKHALLPPVSKRGFYKQKSADKKKVDESNILDLSTRQKFISTR